MSKFEYDREPCHAHGMSSAFTKTRHLRSPNEYVGSIGLSAIRIHVEQYTF